MKKLLEIISVVGGLAAIAAAIFLPLEILFKIIIFFLPPILLIFAIILVGITVTEKTGKADGFIRLVPKNHAWVLRTALFSDPGDPFVEPEREPKGYCARSEGYAWRIPVWHIDEGMVCLQPKQRDIPAINVISKDGIPMIVDAQLTTAITDPVKFIVNMPGNTVEEKEKKRIETENAIIHTATNRATRKYHTDELAALKVNGRNIRLGDVAKYEMEKDKALNLNVYGIEIKQIGVQTVYSPAEIESALSRKKAAEIKKIAAEDEGEAGKIIIDKTGADPTGVMITRTIVDTLRPIIFSFLKNKKNIK